MQLWKIMRGLVISVMSFLAAQHLLQIITGGKITGSQLDGLLSVPSKSYSVSSQNTAPKGVFFKPDGTKMYVTRSGGGFSLVYQYSLSTAWDVSTATYDSVQFDTSFNFSSPQGIFFKPDGTKMYLCSVGVVGQFTLSTAWDVSTASYDGQGDISGVISSFDLYIKSDGLKAYFVGESALMQWNLSSAWDFVGYSRSGSTKTINTVNTPEGNHTGLAFSSDGLIFLVVGTDNKTLYKWSLSTAWDVSTATYSNESFDLNDYDGDPRSLFLGDSDANLYMVGDTNNSVYQFNFGTSLPTSNDVSEKRKKLGAFRRLIRSGSLRVLQDNTTASSIIAASEVATDEINSL